MSKTSVVAPEMFSACARELGLELEVRVQSSWTQFEKGGKKLYISNNGKELHVSNFQVPRELALPFGEVHKEKDGTPAKNGKVTGAFRGSVEEVRARATKILSMILSNSSSPASHASQSDAQTPASPAPVAPTFEQLDGSGI